MPDVSMDTIANLTPELQRAFQMAVKAEKRPIEVIENRKNAIQEKVNLLSDVLGRIDGVKGCLPNLNSPLAIRELAVKSDDERILSATADKNLAEPGKHVLEVSQLAKSATALSNRFSDKDETRIGSGFFHFTTLSGETKEVFVDDENSTLEGLARIINQANLGMKATVVNDQADPEAPYRLVLSANATGTQGDIEYPEFYFIDGQEDFYIEEANPASNARFSYQGFEFESATNEISDLIKGVTLNLKGLCEPGRPVALSIEQDLPKTTVKLKDLVGNLNKVFSFIQEQNKLDENSDTSKTLGGDYGIRMADNRLKEALRENFLFDPDKSVQSMFDIGIQFNRNGLLDFDEKQFQHSLQTNFDEVVEMLAGDGITYGIIPRLGRALQSISNSSSGLLSAQKNNYLSRIKQITQDVENREKRAEERIEKLKDRLSRAQAALTRLGEQSKFIQAPESLIPTSLMPLAS